MSDQLARERGTQALDTSIALSAGAGTGKTTVLVHRIVGLLARGTPPERIVAITFTEKAAGELLSRTRDALESAVRERPDPALTGALARFGALRVSTIHAFCKDLLNSEALAAKWAPRVEIDTLPGQPSAADAAFARWRRDFEAREPQVGRLLRLMRAQTRRAAGTLASFRDLGPAVTPDPFDVALAFAELRVVQGRLEAAARSCRILDDKLLAKNAPLRSVLTQALQVGGFDGLVRVLATRAGPSRAGGRQGDWIGMGKQAFLDALAEYTAWRGAVLTRIHGVVVRDLHARYLPMLRDTQAEAGVADFDDLLFRALELLDDHDARARLADRLDALLVDEVQDTDPIQARIAVLLSRAPEARGAWNTVAPRPGALFAVGDPKQSIYRFRRADVHTWSELEQVVASDGERHALARSFRSVPGIVAWVNHTFSQMPGYAPLVPVRGAAELDPVVQLEAEEGGSDDAVVRHLLALRATGARVKDRPLSWRDVMVLLPAWSHAEPVRKRLEEAGIPALVEGGSAFFARDEVRLSLAAMRAIDEPADAEAVVFALRGLFGFSHVDLARHVQAGGSWRITLPTHPPGPVGEALIFLRDLHGERSRRGWVDLLDAVFEHTRATVVWSLRRDGQARLANLDKLRALIRETEPGARTPGEVIERLRAFDAEADLSRSDVDGDMVRITSYFKAKGLEAPVVVLVHPKRSRMGVVHTVDRTNGRIAVSLGGELTPPGWDGLVIAEKQAENEERERWMYVATTRARDQLVIVREAVKQNLLQETAMSRGLVDGAHGAHIAVAPGVHVRVRSADQLPPAPSSAEVFVGLDAEVDAALAAAPALTEDTSAVHRARVRGAVRAGARKSARWRSVQELCMRARVKGSADGVGKLGGVVVHDVMNRLDLSRPREELLAEAPGLTLALAGRLDAETAARCVDVVRRLLQHPVLDRARAAPERWQEAPFTFADRGRTVAGTIDLCFPLDNARTQWMVVDWKSSLPPEGSPLRADYERQLAWYARALLATVGAVSVETCLVGPHPELGAASADEQALDGVHDALSAGLRALLDRGAPVPAVGLDVGEPVVAQLELAWPTLRIGLALDLDTGEIAALRAQGWTVHDVATDAVGWPEAAVAWLGPALGLAEET